MSPYTTASDIQNDARSGLIGLLYRLADDDLVMGHRNSEWTGLAPILEADIAFSSIAQDQMGQARAYYQLLHELGERDPDTNAFLRDASEFRCCSLTCLERSDWAFSTVRLFLYETAKGLRTSALIASSYKPLADLARKIRGEQKYHGMHAEMWIRRLGHATTGSHDRMQAALNQLYPHGLGQFEPTAHEGVLETDGIAPTEAALCGLWRDQAGTILAESGLTVPVEVEPVYGGRQGHHPVELSPLIEGMQKVYRLDPMASW